MRKTHLQKGWSQSSRGVLFLSFIKAILKAALPLSNHFRNTKKKNLPHKEDLRGAGRRDMVGQRREQKPLGLVSSLTCCPSTLNKKR